jgi:nitrite reductase/ring-hydroxylating ferredoxin subunit
MDGFRKVGKARDFPDRRGKAVVVSGVPVAVFREGSRFVAVGDTCPHMRASLADGKLDGAHVECRMHGWKFDVLTGRSQSRTGASVRVYEVRVEEGDVFLRAPASAAPPEGAANAPGRDALDE